MVPRELIYPPLTVTQASAMARGKTSAASWGPQPPEGDAPECRACGEPLESYWCFCPRCGQRVEEGGSDGR